MSTQFSRILAITVVAGGFVLAAPMVRAAQAPVSPSGGLLQYALPPLADGHQTARRDNAKPIKLASRRSRRRNRAIAAGIAIGIAALIIADSIERDRRRKVHRYHDRPRRWRPTRRQCRKWARRCDWGNDRACIRWDRHCR